MQWWGGGEPRGEAEMAAVARVSGDGWEWRQSAGSQAARS